ncbi:hypothetical protein FA95DRAFT_1569932 [Auriscalpium vulgare]|uniref:Uncharacterized protein n=1 Tax=Auriscalpium vulgare TaxID=40419 RepID=A0ACB8S5U8_9AGAM|nr:hypothetical protein FA95DRAFT_1569932 [Auriscalpium vulgare]
MSFQPLLVPLAAEVCETMFFGLYTALFAFSTYALLYGRPLTRPRLLILAATVAMYAVSALHWASNTAVLVQSLHAEPPVYKMSAWQEGVVIYVPIINYILSDAIVLWRAWVIWERRIALVVLPIVFMFGSLVCGCVSALYTIRARTTESIRDVNLGFYIGIGVWVFTTLTNIWATFLIGIKAWQYRRFVRSLMGKASMLTKAERGLALLIESGLLYVFLWAAYEATYFASSQPSLVFDAIIVQLVGIYPTIIVIIVTLKMSSADMISKVDCSHNTAISVIYFNASASDCPSQMT